MEDTPTKMGRPSDYTQEIADYICDQVSIGRSLVSIAKEDKCPHLVTVYRWFREHEDFRKNYEIAIEQRTETQHEQLVEMGDEAINALKEKGMNPALATAYKIKADNFKWVMARMKPKRWGDKMDVTSGGEQLKGNTIIFSDFKDEAAS